MICNDCESMSYVTSSTWSWHKLPPGTVVCQHCCAAQIGLSLCVQFALSLFPRMAAQRDDSVLDDVVASEEELEKALCVLAGSDPDNCSYSRVRKASCTASLQPSPLSAYCRFIAFSEHEYSSSTLIVYSLRVLYSEFHSIVSLRVITAL